MDTPARPPVQKTSAFPWPTLDLLQSSGRCTATISPDLPFVLGAMFFGIVAF